MEIQPPDGAAAQGRRARPRAFDEGQSPQRLATAEVRQPQIAPGRALAWLLLAFLLALPALSAARTVCAAAAFLVEFLSEDRLPLLSALTPNPARAPLADGHVPIDLYRPLTLGTPPALVLVHGR